MIDVIVTFGGGIAGLLVAFIVSAWIEGVYEVGAMFGFWGKEPKS